MIWIVLSIILTSCTEKPETLRVGAASVNISPANPVGFSLEGYAGIDTRSTGLHDSLSVRCIVMDDGTTKVALVTLDLLGVVASDVQKVSARIEDVTGVPAGNIIIHTIHTHKAPAMIGYNGDKVSETYKEKVFSQTVACAQQALALSQPAVAKFGAGVSEGSTGNRRNPGQKLDNELSVVDFQDSDGNSIATMVNFACHPVSTDRNIMNISADYVHYLREMIETRHGGVSVFFNGAIGDINPYGRHVKNTDLENLDPYDLTEKIGNAIGDDALGILRNAQELPVSIRVATQQVHLPVENPLFLQLVQLPVFKSSFYDGCLESSISIIDLGPAQILTFPGEATSEFRNILEPLLPGDYPFFLSLSNDCIGYIISEPEWETAASGAYEETVSLGKGVAPVLEKEYMALAHTLFGEQ